MKYKVNIQTTFMDGTRANPGDVVDLDPAKVTDLDAVERTIINMTPAIERLPDDPPVKSPRPTKVDPPAQEVTANDQ